MTTTAADDAGDPGAPEPGAAAEAEAEELGDPAGDGGAEPEAPADPTGEAATVDGVGLSDAAAEADGWAGAGPT